SAVTTLSVTSTPASTLGAALISFSLADTLTSFNTPQPPPHILPTDALRAFAQSLASPADYCRPSLTAHLVSHTLGKMSLTLAPVPQCRWRCPAPDGRLPHGAYAVEPSLNSGVVAPRAGSPIPPSLPDYLHPPIWLRRSGSAPLPTHTVSPALCACPSLSKA